VTFGRVAKQATAPPPGLMFARTARLICEAQRFDFEAACEGKITWQQYFLRWGKCGLG
jgi:hypothetical protein